MKKKLEKIDLKTSNFVIIQKDPIKNFEMQKFERAFQSKINLNIEKNQVNFSKQVHEEVKSHVSQYESNNQLAIQQLSGQDAAILKKLQERKMKMRSKSQNLKKNDSSTCDKQEDEIVEKSENLKPRNSKEDYNMSQLVSDQQSLTKMLISFRNIE